MNCYYSFIILQLEICIYSKKILDVVQQNIFRECCMAPDIFRYICSKLYEMNVFVTFVSQ
jgi:hypothetical protein